MPEHGRRQREAPVGERRFGPNHRGGLLGQVADRGQDLFGRTHLHVPVATDLGVRGVGVVAQHDRPVGGRDHQQPHRQEQEERRGEPGTRRTPDPATRQVGGHPARPPDPPVETSKHEQQQAQGQERDAEQQQRGCRQDQRIDRASARASPRCRPATGGRRRSRGAGRTARRAPVRATAAPRARRPDVPRTRCVSRADTRARSRSAAAHRRRQQTEDLGSGVEVDGEDHPGKRLAVRPTGELRQHQARSRPSGYATTA